jgi:hypothetical protein
MIIDANTSQSSPARLLTIGQYQLALASHYHLQMGNIRFIRRNDICTPLFFINTLVAYGNVSVKHNTSHNLGVSRQAIRAEGQPTKKKQPERRFSSDYFP